MDCIIKKNDLVLLQGDSITDCHRDREISTNMGKGYANMVAAWFSALHPEMNVRFLNRGISGNRVVDLNARWQEDCLDLKPNVLSILIGVNDCWRRYDRNDPTSIEKFTDGYRLLLERTREGLGDIPILLMEPFVLPIPEDRIAWREDIDPKIQAVRAMAREFNTMYLPLDGLFATAMTKQKPEFWAPDGVHPTQAGHALIAQAWLKAMGVTY